MTLSTVRKAIFRAIKKQTIGMSKRVPTAVPSDSDTGEEEDTAPPTASVATATPITSPASKKKRGKRDLSSLQEGGVGGRSRSAKAEESPWTVYSEDADRKRAKVQYLKDDNLTIIPFEGKCYDDKPSSVPDPTRSIIENESLATLISNNLCCKFCRGQVKLSFDNERNSGLAVIPTLTCSGTDCSRKVASIRQGTNFPPSTGRKRKYTEYAINVEHVLSLMASGDGGTEAAKVVSFLDLPHPTTWGGYSFRTIEKEVHPKIIDAAEGLLHDQLHKEVEAIYKGTDLDYKAWKLATENPSIKMEISQYARVTVTMDGAWNQRSSGRAYSSKSGFSILVGTSLWQPIAYSVRSTFCRVCSHKSHAEGEVPQDDHNCTINHQGSPGGMEPAGLLSMTHYVFDKYRLVLERVVIDDDTTMRTWMRWPNEDYERIHGHILQAPITK